MWIVYIILGIILLAFLPDMIAIIFITIGFSALGALITWLVFDAPAVGAWIGGIIGLIGWLLKCINDLTDNSVTLFGDADGNIISSKSSDGPVNGIKGLIALAIIIGFLIYQSCS